MQVSVTDMKLVVNW